MRNPNCEINKDRGLTLAKVASACRSWADLYGSGAQYRKERLRR